MSQQPSDGGLALLSGPDAGALLTAVATDRGWTITRWSLEHVDHQPGQSTTATYSVKAATRRGARTLLFGFTCRRAGPTKRDANAQTFERDGVRVVAWVYPDDPSLAGLPMITYPSRASELLAGAGLVAPGAAVGLRMVTYRPRRRAVVRVQAEGKTWFAKAMKDGRAAWTAERHDLLRAAGVPAPPVDLLRADDDVVVLTGLGGEPLSRAIFDEPVPISGESIVTMLDGLPAAATTLPRRASWASMVEHYASLVAAQAPAEQDRLTRMLDALGDLADDESATEPTHGDFHEGQVHVAGGRIVGLLDVDGLGPGRRVDDLACLVAHLSTIQRMNPQQEARVQSVLDAWLPVFDERVDPVDLRRRAAAVTISLATGPYRGQEPGWQTETAMILDAGERLLAQAHRLS